MNTAISGTMEIHEAYADSNLAGVAYASSILSSRVKYSEWTPSTESWSPEISLQDTGSQIVDAKILFSPASSLRAILSASTNGDLNLFTCSNSCTAAPSWTHVGGGSFANTGLLSLLSLTPKRPFDMAFEQSSGDLVISYDKGLKLVNRFYYRVFSAATETLSAESSHQYSGGLIVHSINYFKMASSPVSDEITMIFYDPLAFTSYGVIWDTGTNTWQDQITVSSAMSVTSLNGESVGVAYETNTGNSIVFSANGLNSAAYARWTGSSWSGVSTTDPEPGSLLNEAIFVSMSSDPSSDRVMICQAGLSLTCAQMDSGVLGGWNDPGPQPLSLLSRAFDYAWDPTGSSGILLSEAGLANDYQSSIWDGSSWAAGQTISANIGHLWVRAATNPFDNDSVNSIFIGSNVLNELDYLTYDGNSLTLQSGGLAATHLGSILFEGASVHFGQDLSSIPQIFSNTILETINVTDSPSRSLTGQGFLSDALDILEDISRQTIRQDLLDEFFTMVDVVLGVLGTATGPAESITIADSIGVVKTPAPVAGGSSGGGSGGGGNHDNSDRSGGGTVAPETAVSPPTIPQNNTNLAPSEPGSLTGNHDALGIDGSTGGGDQPTESSDSITHGVSDGPDIIDNNSGGIQQTVPIAPESSHAASLHEGDASLRNIGIVAASVLLPAVLAPVVLLHLSGKKWVSIDGIFIDSASISKRLGLQNNSEMFWKLVDLQYELCWNTGLEPEDVKMVLDQKVASSIGIDHVLSTSGKGLHGANGGAETAELGRKMNQGRTMNSGIIIARDSEFVIERIRSELEKRVVVDGGKWFVVSSDDFSYGKKRFEEMLYRIADAEHRAYKTKTLLETFTHLNLLLSYAGDPRFMITIAGEILYHNRFVHNQRFKSKQGKAKALSIDEWIRGQLEKAGVKLTKEGANMMSMREKRELLIDTVVEQLTFQGTSGRVILESS